MKFLSAISLSLVTASSYAQQARAFEVSVSTPESYKEEFCIAAPVVEGDLADWYSYDSPTALSFNTAEAFAADMGDRLTVVAVSNGVDKAAGFVLDAADGSGGNTTATCSSAAWVGASEAPTLLVQDDADDDVTFDSDTGTFTLTFDWDGTDTDGVLFPPTDAAIVCSFGFTVVGLYSPIGVVDGTTFVETNTYIRRARIEIRPQCTGGRQVTKCPSANHAHGPSCSQSGVGSASGFGPGFASHRQPVCFANDAPLANGGGMAVQCCRSGIELDNRRLTRPPPTTTLATTTATTLVPTPAPYRFGGYEHSECVTSQIAVEEGDECADDEATSSLEPNFELAGWATLDGGVTGGAGGNEVTVSTGIELQEAIFAANLTDEPTIIYVDGTITPNNSDNAGRTDFLDRMIVYDRVDLSIIGVGTNGELHGISLYIRNSHNIIVRNLNIHHVPKEIYKGDCITIDNSTHIWIDHNELHHELYGVDGEFYDGLLDIRRMSEYITVSWNHLHDGWKASLVGSNEEDTFDRKITYHHNRFNDINSRLPSLRGGQGHMYNNFFQTVLNTAVNSRIGACILVENNYFAQVHNPWGSHSSDVVGNLHLVGNALVDNSTFSNDRVPAGECTLEPPYAYVADDARVARAQVLTNVGVGIVSGNGVGVADRCGAREQCFADVASVAEAEEFCANLRVYPETAEDEDEGWRLCTVEEIGGGACCDTPCRSRNDKIPTSDACDPEE